ncbi:2,3-bisphosphoglycerate-independent phosphoglycerate mutase [Patescibacteria group bacterium]|nr:2,3-bisphosphoglycerate-independent phosphoglycerate mutase [Patescibacteria group bacterium]
MPYKPVIIIILDGFGVSTEPKGNAVAEAHKTTFEYLEKFFPFVSLQTSGVAVGLPFGEAGNSEVGHLTMGAGRVVYHHLPRIVASIRDNTFYQNPAFLKAAEHVKKNNSRLHLFGLVSSGSVHSYAEHFRALFLFAKRQNLPNVFLHIITDGKDAPPQEGKIFIENLQKELTEQYPNVTIASVIGRFYAMDRDEHWDRVQKCFNLLTKGEGAHIQNPIQYLGEEYQKNVFDDAIEPAQITDQTGNPIGIMQNNDALIMFNFREDSMREITKPFAAPESDFDYFSRTPLKNFLLVTMTGYEKNLAGEVAFPSPQINWPLGRVIAKSGKTQLHIAESEKYAHVTYFFNGGEEKPFTGEDRILIPSIPQAHADEAPEMQAEAIAKAITDNISKYDFIVANFANADMVGHTGNLPAAIQAVETLDKMIGNIIEQALKTDAVLAITGDHGNAEQKLNRITGERRTKHSINAVPFFLVGKNFMRQKDRSNEEILAMKNQTAGIITDVAPTVLALMNLEQPDEMTGQNLLPQLLQQTPQF